MEEGNEFPITKSTNCRFRVTEPTRAGHHQIDMRSSGAGEEVVLPSTVRAPGVSGTPALFSYAVGPHSLKNFLYPSRSLLFRARGSSSVSRPAKMRGAVVLAATPGSATT